jgi:hypothetical protein
MAPEQPKHRTGEASAFAGYRGAPGAGQLTGAGSLGQFQTAISNSVSAVGNANRESGHKLPLFLIVFYCGARARRSFIAFMKDCLDNRVE